LDLPALPGVFAGDRARAPMLLEEEVAGWKAASTSSMGPEGRGGRALDLKRSGFASGRLGLGGGIDSASSECWKILEIAI